jgi:ElaB/YqjD/DUF883 family membrane-anchored ribosome-binding protein
MLSLLNLSSIMRRRWIMAGTNEGGSGHPRMTAGYPTGSSAPTEEAKKGLKETAQEMASTVSETAGHVKDKTREFVSGVAGQAEDAWRSTQEGLREGASAVAHKAEDFWGDATRMIQRYPVASVAIAFGLGCLFSSALALSSHGDDIARRMSRASS